MCRIISIRFYLIISSLCMAVVLVPLVAKGQTEQAGGGKTTYKYRQYQKFDFEDIKVEGESGSPGDLSVGQRFQKKFKNELPYRTNFNAQIRRAVERIR